jgi:hypothetical protein
MAVKEPDLARNIFIINFTHTPLHPISSPLLTVQVNQRFRTICNRTVVEHVYLCSNGFSIHHYCDGDFLGVLITQCPSRVRSRPVCGVIQRDVNNEPIHLWQDHCQVLSFGNQTLVCQCLLTSNSLEILPYVKSAYTTPLRTASEFEEESVESVIVVMLFMFLWFAILAIGFLCHYVDPSKSYSVSNMATNIHSSNVTAAATTVSQRSRRRGKRKNFPSGSLAAYAYVLKYIDKTIPFVFRPNKSLSKQLSCAIFLHHRYIRIFTTSSGGSSGLRILQVFHFLTAQTCVLFILWVILEIQVCLSSSLLFSRLPLVFLHSSLDLLFAVSNSNGALLQ